ncbi:MAG: acyl carrier protein [Anderseniella sp.]
MNDQEISELVKRALFEVAPDLEDEIIDPETPFRDQFEFDSMDFLNFVIGIHQVTGVEIPEADYPQLTSLKDSISYLRARNG